VNRLVTLALLPLSFLILTSCVDVRDMPNFERMSEAELAEYNRQRPIAQMIVCSDESRSFSRVRRRHCATVEQMYGSVDNLERLDVLNIPGGGTVVE